MPDSCRAKTQCTKRGADGESGILPVEILKVSRTVQRNFLCTPSEEVKAGMRSVVLCCLTLSCVVALRLLCFALPGRLR